MKTFKLMLSIFILILSSAFLISKLTFADSNSQPQVDESPMAQDACADADEGDVCSFVDSNAQTINGSCHYPNSGDAQLTCAPISN